MLLALSNSHLLWTVQCPGWAVCYKNVSWSEFPSGMCACQTTYGYVGSNCNEFGEGAIPMLVISLVSMLVDFWVAIQMSMLFWRKLQGHVASKTRTQWTSLEATGMFDFIASLAGIGMSILFITKIVAVYPRGPDGKQELNSEVGNIAFALFFVFTNFAALNVSQTWAKVALSAKRLSLKFTNRYEKFLIVYFSIIIIAMIAMFCLGMDSTVTYLCIPAILFMIFTYMYAGWSLEILLKQSATINEKFSGDNTEYINRALYAVAATAKQVSIVSAICVVFLVAYASLPNDIDRPGMPVAWNVLRPGYLMGSLINLIVQRYLTIYLRHGSGFSSSTHGTSRIKEDVADLKVRISMPNGVSKLNPVSAQVSDTPLA